MKTTPIIVAAILMASPLHAHEPEKGESLFPSEEKLQQLGRLAETWMREFADEVSPMMERLKNLIDDASAYAPPEMMPNGDIIIRRIPKPAPEGPEIDPEQGVDL